MKLFACLLSSIALLLCAATTYGQNGAENGQVVDRVVYATPGQRTVVNFDFADNPFAGAKKLPDGMRSAHTCPCGCVGPCQCKDCPAYQVASAPAGYMQVCDGKTCRLVKMPSKASTSSQAASKPVSAPDGRFERRHAVQRAISRQAASGAAFVRDGVPPASKIG